MALRFGCLESPLSRSFRSYGQFLARHPFAVLLFSVVVAGVLSCGIVFVEFQSDTEELFTPDVSRARDEQAFIQSHFPTNFDNFIPTRVTEMYQRLVWVIATAKDDGSIFRNSIIDEIFTLRETIISTTVSDDSGTVFGYHDLCGKLGGACSVNPVLQWIRFSRQHNQSLAGVPYPIAEFPVGDQGELETLPLDPFLGSVVVEDGFAKSAKALSLFFYLRHEPADLNAVSGRWEDAVVDALEAFHSKEISFVYYTSDAVDEAQKNLAVGVLPYFASTLGTLVVFAVASCMMKDWVLSKPWLACSGVISAGLAVASCTGFLSFCGLALNQVAVSMPFLILGIGLDDTFIMLAAWRKTDPSSSVESRMGEALSEAAVSITITSVTDFLAFCAGTIVPLPAVRTFCVCTGVAILMDLFYQLTFFGSFMVFTGRREVANRHCYFFFKVVSQEESPSLFYRLLCSGGYKWNTGNPSLVKKQDHLAMAFFRDYFSPVVTHPFSMVLISVLYAAYVATAVYGLLHLEEGLELENLAEKGSMTNRFFDLHAKYYDDHGPPVSVMMTDDLNYWDPKVQQDLQDVVETFEACEYSRGGNFTEYWLADFTKYAHHMNLTIDSEETFSRALQGFLKVPMFSKYREDLNFDDTGNITSSRFLIATGSLASPHEQSKMMIKIRELADECPQNISFQVFSPNFIVFEQFLIVLPTTLQNLLIATLAILLVAMLLIPSPVVALVITFCVVSIETGVVGFMSLWEVNLDSISMIHIILCIGFSVDFSAHISYSFVLQPRSVSPSQRAANSLYSLGFPITQSALSTILGVLTLFATNSYIFEVFAKIMVLVMSFGLLHGLFFLPVVFTVTSYCCSPKGGKRVSTDDEESDEGNYVQEEEDRTTDYLAIALQNMRETDV